MIIIHINTPNVIGMTSIDRGACVCIYCDSYSVLLLFFGESNI